MAPRWASSRWTRRRWPICISPGGRKNILLLSRPTARSRCFSARTQLRRHSSTTHWNWTSDPLSRPWPGRSGRRTAWRCDRRRLPLRKSWKERRTSMSAFETMATRSLMLGAGLLAKKAVERGLQVKPWVKTSLAPGSKVVTNYLAAAGLTPYLEKLNFHLVGYGCTTCIGNSGPLSEPIGAAIKDNNLIAVAVLSGNRNFEGRIH